MVIKNISILIHLILLRFLISYRHVVTWKYIHIEGEHMKRLPVNLKDKQHEDLRRIAFEENKSISDIVRMAIDKFIKERSEGDIEWRRR